MREELSFTPSDEHVVALRPSNGKRYSLKPWQYVMMCRFDGAKTFEQLGREIYNEFSGLITAKGLLNFYSWLYDESLVLCNFESVFELASQEEEEDTPRLQLAEKLTRIVSHPKVPVVAMSAVGVMFCLAVVRIAYVAAPIFEPPVDRLYSEIGERFMNDSEAPIVERQAMVRAAEPIIESIEPAALIEEIPEPPVIEASKSAKPLEMAADEMKSSDSAAQTDFLLDRMDTLRQEMAGCRIRRDEFYLQNNEKGYRREVEKMTELAKEIGEIGTSL
jgi:hypothetical protein